MVEARKNAERNAQVLSEPAAREMVGLLISNMQQDNAEMRRSAVHTLAEMVRNGFEIPADNMVTLMQVLEGCKKDAECAVDAQFLIDNIWGEMRLAIPMKRSME